MIVMPELKITWRLVESSNIEAVGWSTNGLWVEFKTGAIYYYRGVSRQRAVALAHAKSVGRYLNNKIKPEYQAERISPWN